MFNFGVSTFACGSENENATVNEDRSCEHEREFHARYHELLLQLKDNVIINKLAFLFQNSLFHFCRGTWNSVCFDQLRNSKLSFIYCNPHYFVIVYEVMQGFSLFIRSIYCLYIVNFIFVEVYIRGIVLL